MAGAVWFHPDSGRIESERFTVEGAAVYRLPESVEGYLRKSVQRAAQAHGVLTYPAEFLLFVGKNGVAEPAE